MPLNLQQAKQLKPGDMLYRMTHCGAPGTPIRWKVNGKAKTWKRNPNKVQIPIKHGLYSYYYLMESNLHLFTLQVDEALEKNRLVRLIKYGTK